MISLYGSLWFYLGWICAIKSDNLTYLLKDMNIIGRSFPENLEKFQLAEELTNQNVSYTCQLPINVTTTVCIIYLNFYKY